MRVGFGYDIHRLIGSRALILGGVRIEHRQGLEAHSDGDVLIHAICDSLLGAAGLGDIGQHFPDSEPEFAGISSSYFLIRCMKLIGDKAYQLENIDCTILAEEPLLNPYFPEMKAKLSELMGVTPQQINLKAGTNEKMDSVGRKEAIAAYAVCLIRNKEL